MKSCVGPSTYTGVLFDFGHTLFDAIALGRRCDLYRTSTNVDVDADTLGPVLEGIRQRSRLAEELAKQRDISADAHRRCWLELMAPLDDLASGLAAVTYSLDCSSDGWRPYPDTVAVLTELARRNVRIGVVSDCGWDIRTAFGEAGLDHLIDTYVLSYEHGICKPAPQLFEAAAASLKMDSQDLLMVGDTWLTDGGAAAVGITTLILPSRDRHAEPALHDVLALLDRGAA